MAESAIRTNRPSRQVRRTLRQNPPCRERADMRHILAIAKRELRSYFVSPIAYVALTMFGVLSGFFFSNMTTTFVRQASLADRQLEGLGRSGLQLDVPTAVLEAFFANQGFILLLV